MKNQSQIQNVLEEWAGKTVKQYHEIASREDVNIAYYTQSDLSLLSEEPELMIIGINPGSYSTYQDQLENENWSYLHKENPYDKDHLLKGNYCHEKGKPSSWDCHRKWGYWNGLKRCLSKTGKLFSIIEDDYKIIITNASFFSTKKANAISESLLKETIPFTLDLIDKTSPRHMIFLSGQKCFERLSLLSKSSKLFQFEYKHICGNIYIGLLNNKFCIGIPHPAYKTNEELNLVASVLPILVNSEKYESIDVASIQKECATLIKEFEERKNGDKKGKEYHRIDKKYIEQQIFQLINLITYDSKNKRFKINDKIGVTVTSKDGGCVELRTIDYDNKNKDFNLAQETLTELREKLKKKEYDVNTEQWIGRKLFSQFGKTDDEVIKSVLDEIEKLKDICKL